ncbi:hypothetical protein BO71DRAFT_191395 [Aspergillus ellipticus CBS 707.79]|uniref:PSI domain-containing protein n=1 Tax=Aspergillus ellipticus CBS 707.79 TaxID=1448320 RepID=A0A319DET1_9EURO|nr:hypothetical protein BO71DRAFT_191395 [Aspergillus ellipticus CBS 707.79]
MDLITTNSSSSLAETDPLFYLCWRRQACGYCLKGDIPCSWCASSTCVPNPTHFPILAPLASEGICPLGSDERWELRALPFGCQVSTITFLTGVGSVVGTLAGLGILVLVAWVVRVVGKKWREGKYLGGTGWRGSYRWLGLRGVPVVEPDEEEDGGNHVEDERRPLLGGTG